VIVPVFYSFQDTRTPVKVAIIALTVDMALNLILMWPLKHGGLALSTSLTSILHFSSLFYYLRKKTGPLGGRKILLSCMKIAAASGLTGAGTWIMLRCVAVHSLSRAYSATVLMVIILGAAVLYAFISYLMGSIEMSFLINMLKGEN